MSSSIVVCDIPRAGLGNQLFPLLKSYLFAKNNGLPIVITGYHQFKIGPYLRGDRTKRRYSGFFTFEKSLIVEQIKKIRWKKSKNKKIYNPDANQLIDKLNSENCTYIFNEIPVWNNYFKDIRDNREEVISIFEEIISSDIKLKLAKLSAPCIGLHMRMGDYKKLSEGVDFNKVGVTRTPEHYFRQVVTDIRSKVGKELAISIFTDGKPNEIKELLSLENVHIVQGNNDLVDLLLLSRSKIVITSAGSTFSYWAGFLSEAPIILHPAHIYNPIRLPEGGMYEGPCDMNDVNLVRAISNINC